MGATIRISTSPPNDWDGQVSEASHYCDLRELSDWNASPIVSMMSPADREEAFQRGMAGYAVFGVHADREVGILICVEDDEQGVVYLGVDRAGRTSRQPAANEALWDAANVELPRLAILSDEPQRPAP